MCAARAAHPFYRWLRTEHGFTPRWNFNKVLIGPEGEVVGTMARPRGRCRPQVRGRSRRCWRDDSCAGPLFIGSEIYRGSSYGGWHPLRVPRVSTVMDL